MKVLVTGSGGQVGSDLLGTAPAGTNVAGFSHAQWDISDREQTARLFEEHHPDIVINCAAYTAVDACESHRDDAFRINARAPGILAACAKEHGCRLIHLSTDYVFDGLAERPYAVDHPRNPQSVYGRSKAEGELAVLETLPRGVVVRTAWVYGPGANNFPQKILARARTQKELRVVSDQMGSPTWSRHLARALWCLPVRPEVNGILHWTASGSCSWFEFARFIVDRYRAAGGSLAAERILPVSSAEFAAPAKRPAYSVLSLDRWNSLFPDAVPAGWQEQFSGYLRATVPS